MLFIAERTTYTGPVTSPDALLASCPELAGQDQAASPHLLSVKAYNSPGLLARCLQSVRQPSTGNVTPLVIDDTKVDELRKENERIASKFGARYYPVLGEFSLVQAFADYIDGTEPKDRGQELSDYLRRITTDYPNDPSGAWGGVGGAQNVSHLANVMTFGESGTPRKGWLSTFIDHDVLLPPNAEDIFRLIGMYHHLGNIGIITSSYLHHAGSPTKLGTQAFRHLVEHEGELTAKELDREMENIFQRIPTVGLQAPNQADRKYSTPEYKLDFPTGNYTLSGDEAFDIPVSIIGLEDRGFSAMLQLFIGARRLGIARVPGFPHVRNAEKDAANGRLPDYFRLPKHKAHCEFMNDLMDYAIAEGVPQENVDRFRRIQRARRMAQLAGLRKLVSTAGELAGRERFAPYVDSLQDLRESVLDFAKTTSDTQNRALDPAFAFRLIKDIRKLHPVLVEKAYQFGTDGQLAQYNQKRNELSA